MDKKIFKEPTARDIEEGLARARRLRSKAFLRAVGAAGDVEADQIETRAPARRPLAAR